MDDTNPPDGDRPDDTDDWDDDEGWLTPVDDDILELMQENYIYAPKHIEQEGLCRGPDAAYRCRELTKRGLLERQAIGMYEITDLGEQFLAGEVHPSELALEDEGEDADENGDNSEDSEDDGADPTE
ncbi:hypothetical protein [Natronorubrum daqingense]|uniref:Uncharacterized protein n=1 Tax=Natronorubrum daqingense TaxID=588898 RepID=A0A1N7FJL8_9EURY|nr:hypothetical protein [Natronorubrum daqingense]APX98323.1 hypothetical protein BB347_16560 [Natronorubrum daqingense]SIS00474.1 hypothetical protein SAMN05421809_3287 [Natronorubrum daqingense]